MSEYNSLGNCSDNSEVGHEKKKSLWDNRWETGGGGKEEEIEQWMDLLSSNLLKDTTWWAYFEKQKQNQWEGLEGDSVT